MALYAISYQLNDEKDYQKLWDEFDRLNAHKVMNTFYFLDLDNGDTLEVKEHFKGFIDDDDAICIVKMKVKPRHHMGKSGTNDWIEDNF